MSSTGTLLKVILTCTILLNVAFGYKYVKTKFQYCPDYTFNRKVLFEYLQIDSNSVVFIGDSQTAQFELAELFKNTNMRNRGVNGERTDGLLNRLPDIIKSHPGKVFIEIEINDIDQGIAKATLLDNYIKMLSMFKKESGSSKIYVQSLLPVYNTGPAVTSSKLNNETIRDVNKDLQAYCKAQDITFINLYDKFESGGQINPKYCIADGLHISGQGYLLWTELLKPYVEE